MIEFIKIDEEIKKILGIDLSENVVLVKKDSKVIGCGKVNKEDCSKTYIFIETECRGNGFGKLLFNKILEEYKNIGFADITISFSNDNIVIKKIVTGARGIPVSVVNNNVTYVIPL
ncbi:MAG: GNAT family N-acetyltransferase [Bacilli bacterium]|nr:GNAT family N-acetyltransferase [Bacilli bacterium]